MAAEPNNKMDRLLRDYAAKRRDLPELPLHPATRRMLQDEVRHVYGNPGSARRGGWRIWWPHLAFGCAVLLIVGLTAAVLNTPNPEKQLAQVTRAPAHSEREMLRADAAKKGVAPPPEPLSEARTLSDEQPAILPERSLSLSSAASQPISKDARARSSEPDLVKAAPPAAFAPALPVRQTSAKEEQDKLASTGATAQSAASRPGVAPYGVVDTPALRTENLTRLNELTNLGAALRTRFVQAEQPPTPVLRNFQFEQLGGQVRFVDYDGSLYFGELQPVSNTAPVTLLFAPDLTSNAAVFSFAASGTNVTLGRLVTIQGQFYDRTNKATPNPAGRAYRRESLSLLTNASVKEAIVGRALIGETEEMPLRAISVQH